ncbi:hypothetical protein MTR67_051679 [Solanum verrucosum]|uniref:Uncharacterized protein n=1 Tax=Solanum verrucosum TaxID=315347 RepID=A0AAF1A2Y3_SOLVR|nr:hypothetical protein MTR67_051679 [Solanum verrucosum]
MAPSQQKSYADVFFFGCGSNAPKKNRFYALQISGEQEGSPDEVNDMLKFFQVDVYALLDPGATFFL